MILEAIIATTVFLTGSSCAAIDNETNKMVWAGPDTPLVSTVYTDEDGLLLPAARYPNDTNALLALVHAEKALQEGPAGHKVRVSCFKSIRGIPHEQGQNSLDHDHA